MNGFCQAADFRALDMAVMRFAFDLMEMRSDFAKAEGDDGEKGDEKPEKETEKQ